MSTDKAASPAARDYRRQAADRVAVTEADRHHSEAEYAADLARELEE